MATEISLPYRLDLSGKVVVETSPDALVRQHVEALVGTEPGERVMLPTYGVPSMATVFTPGINASEILATQTERAMDIWEPGVVLTSVIPSVTESGVAGVAVTYQRADSADSALSPKHVNTALISVGGTVKEIIRG